MYLQVRASKSFYGLQKMKDSLIVSLVIFCVSCIHSVWTLSFLCDFPGLLGKHSKYATFPLLSRCFVFFTSAKMSPKWKTFVLTRSFLCEIYSFAQKRANFKGLVIFSVIHKLQLQLNVASLLIPFRTVRHSLCLVQADANLFVSFSINNKKYRTYSE